MRERGAIRDGFESFMLRFDPALSLSPEQVSLLKVTYYSGAAHVINAFWEMTTLAAADTPEADAEIAAQLNVLVDEINAESERRNDSRN